MVSFKKAFNILQQVEYNLLMKKKKRQVENIFFQKFQKFILDIAPIGLLEKGFGLYIKDFKKFIFWFILGIIVVWYFSNNKQEFFQNFQLIFIISIVVAFFPLPSSYINYSIEQEDIDFVLKIFHDNYLKVEEITKIKLILDDFKLRTKQRLNRLRGVVILLWSLNGFLATQTIELHNLQINQYTSLLVWIFTISLVAYFAIETYDKGVWYIFKSIDFALLEYEDNVTIFKKSF